MNNTVDERVRRYTDDPEKQFMKKQKIKRSTTKLLRQEAKQLQKSYMKIADIIQETTSANIAVSMAGGNGFANGGPGTVIRRKKKKEDVDPEKKNVKK